VRVRGACGELTIGAWHGIHGERYSAQLDAVEEWLQKERGAVLIGDANAIPCIRWRLGERELTPRDKRWRRFTGWTCVCCRTTGAVRQETSIVDGEGGPEVKFTRRDKRQCGKRQGDDGGGASEAEAIPYSRLDVAVEWGSELSRWHAVETKRLKPRGRDISDHDFIVVERAAAARPNAGTSRPLPIKLAGTEQGRMLRAAVTASRHAGEFQELARTAREEARDRGTSEEQAVSDTLVARAVKFQAEV
jgi:hypothetical protein